MIFSALGPFPSRFLADERLRTQKFSSGVRMKAKNPYYVAKAGCARIFVYECQQFKNGKLYAYYSVADTTSGKRKCRTFSDPQRAKEFADDLVLAVGEAPELLSLTPVKRHVQNALEQVAPLGLRIDDATRLLAEALKVVSPNELIDACLFWRDQRPVGFAVKKFDIAVEEFLAQQKADISLHRQKTNACYLGRFKVTFGPRNMHEISADEIDRTARDTGWSKSTRNDALNLICQLFEWGVMKRYVVENPATKDLIKRAKRQGGGQIGILAPSEARRIMNSIEDELKPFMALWLWSGCRKEEISKLSWAQVHAGIEANAIYLKADQTKTGKARSVPICVNLRQWLMAYRKANGRLLPEQWHGRDDKHQIQRLDDLTQHVSRMSELDWVSNGPRHSYATHHLKLDQIRKMYFMQCWDIGGGRLFSVQEDWGNLTSAQLNARKPQAAGFS